MHATQVLVDRADSCGAVFCIEASRVETVAQLHAVLAPQEAAFGQVNARLLDYMDYSTAKLGP